MTHPASGNPTWQDWPSQATLIDATSLERIEAFLDKLARPPDGGVAAYSPTAAAVGAGQSLAALTATRVQLAVTLRSTALVTRNVVSPGHTFTLNETGLWAVSYNVGEDNAAAGTKRAHIVQDGTPDAVSPMAMANLTTAATGVPTYGTGSFVGRLAEGTVLHVYAYSVVADRVTAQNTSITIAYLGHA